MPVGIVKSLAANRSGREALAYWLALGAAVAVIAAVYLFLRSRRGLALTAIRDSEAAASGLGIDIWRTKLEVYVVTSAFTAVIGGLIFLQKLRISPDAAFSINDWTAFVIFIVVIGGIGTLEGPIIGTLIFFALRETLADFGTIYLMVLGLVAIVVMLKAPKGVWGLIRERFDLAGQDEDDRFQVAAELATTQIEDLVRRGFRRFHIYTQNRARLVIAIYQSLGLLPPATPN